MIDAAEGKSESEEEAEGESTEIGPNNIKVTNKRDNNKNNNSNHNKDVEMNKQQGSVSIL